MVHSNAVFGGLHGKTHLEFAVGRQYLVRINTNIKESGFVGLSLSWYPSLCSFAFGKDLRDSEARCYYTITSHFVHKFETNAINYPDSTRLVL